MSAVMMRVRAELRARWRAWVGLGLILGLAGGAAIACAAGARRTSSAYPRFLVAQRAADVITGGAPQSIDAQEALAAIERFPEVVASARMRVVAGAIRVADGSGGERTVVVPDVIVATSVAPGANGEEYGATLNSFKIVEGRLPAPGENDLAAINFILADRYSLGVGDEVTILLGDPFGEPQKEVVLRLIGISAAPGEFQGIGTLTTPSIAVARTFPDRFPRWMPAASDTQANGVALILRNGRRDFPAFQHRLRRTEFADVDLSRGWDHAAGVQRSMGILAATLWAAGAILALTALAVFGQSIARQIALDAEENPSLGALGFTHRQLWAAAMARTSASIAVGVPIAVVVAWAGSPVFPLGVARIAEPSQGPAFDLPAIGVGVAGIVLLAVGLATWPAARAARIGTGRADRPRPSAGARAAAAIAASPATVTGVRLALEPGRGRTAVPVRSTIAGVALGVAAITTAVVVAASLSHLLETPALAGQTYDAIVVPQDENAPDAADAVESTGVVSDAANGTVANGVVGDQDVFGAVFEESAPIGFALIDGRVPTDEKADGLDAVALGTHTMSRLGLALGDDVTVDVDTGDGFVPMRARVVGRVAIPANPFGVAEQGEGFAVSLGTFNRHVPGEGGCCFVRFREGLDKDAAAATLADAGFGVFMSVERQDLNTLATIGDAPVVLAGILGVIAAAVLVHALTTSIRRRRRDIAVLKTLGFVRGQVRRAIAVQATVIAVLAAAIGLPAGVAAGRWGWRFFAFRFGVIPESVVPGVLLVVAVPAVALLANLIAASPARAAARTRPAIELRTE